jgi:NADPH:quinone reductase-like Zn-dependent oxidoreductase
VDAALDFVGGEAVGVSRQVLKSPERVASIVDADALENGGHYVWVRPDPADLMALAEMADQGRLAVRIDRALPLAEAAEAWRISRAGHTRGKLVLTVGEH